MITCEEFLAEFGDYLENQVSPEIRQGARVASLPVPRVPGAVRFQPQDYKDRDRKWFLRVAAKRLRPNHRTRHDKAADRPQLTKSKSYRSRLLHTCAVGTVSKFDHSSAHLV